jgi:hypothetical protein
MYDSRCEVAPPPPTVFLNTCVKPVNKSLKYMYDGHLVLMINLIIANLVLSAKVLSANQQRLNNKFLHKIFFGGFVKLKWQS